ncbi:MAG: DUF4434 domain-containing protein [Candidatus Hydrogenedentes bacterium]|nr:DUF4434 domain-containing protein [Candidatus Hydrogenedentota bacterium]
MRYVAVLLLSCLSIAAAGESALRTSPLMRGTLWWLSDAAHGSWTRAQFEQAIGEQRAVGFDILWLLNTPSLFRLATAPDAKTDPLALIYEIADANAMRVIADLPKGGWYGKTTAEAMASEMRAYAEAFSARYGAHASFHGWYINHEINPIAPDDKEQTTFWRTAWKEAASACHRVAPKSVVTVSPFFMMDSLSRRGFRYQTPEEYASWWGESLKETGIDILMLQDSGAEHLSFFTVADREPFFAAMRKACDEAGAQFWVNVETGEAHVANWEEFIALERENKVPWRFTPIDWLEQKLQLAARYGDGIINWGYFPFMDPAGGTAKPEVLAAYEAYRTYVNRVKASAAVSSDRETK